MTSSAVLFASSVIWLMAGTLSPKRADARVAIEHDRLPLEGVVLGIALTAAAAALGSRRHPIVVMPELVKQDMKELVVARRVLGEVAPHIAFCLWRCRHAETLE